MIGVCDVCTLTFPPANGMFVSCRDPDSLWKCFSCIQIGLNAKTTAYAARIQAAGPEMQSLLQQVEAADPLDTFNTIAKIDQCMNKLSELKQFIAQN